MDTTPEVQVNTSGPVSVAEPVETGEGHVDIANEEQETEQAVDQPEPEADIRPSTKRRDGTERLTGEDMKMARKERMRRNLKLRFTLDDSEPYIHFQEEVDEEVDEESTRASENEDSLGDKRLSTLQSSIHELKEDEFDVDNIFIDDEEDEDSFLTLLPPKCDTVQAKENFLQMFEMPSLSDISEESETVMRSSHMASQHSLAAKSSTALNEGKFVDAVTGDADKSSSSSSSESSESADVVLDSDDGLLSFTDDFDDFKPPAPVPEEDLDALVKFQTSFVKMVTTGDDEAEFEALRQREVAQLTIDFLHDLFNTVVNTAENVNADILLRNKLDNLKLHKSLSNMVRAFMFEKDTNSYLNGKMCEYFKRMKNFRVFTSLEHDIAAKEHIRYQEAMALLDYRLNVVSETKKKNAVLMSSVLMDLSYVQNISMYTEEHLEEVIMRTLGTNKSDFIKRTLERECRLMSQKRNEISDTRLFLITRKHTLGRIVDKIKKLEQINEELCMDDFISIQNQVVALDKKIEERNNDLKKLRYNYHTELHLTQHNREKALALESKLLTNQITLTSSLHQQRTLRERLYAAKLERSSIRKQHSDLTFQGGLLAMPGLMFDYDETVQKVLTKQATVKELKETFKRVNQRIVDLESRCA